MNPKLSQEDNDFLDKCNEMPFEEASPIVRKLMRCSIRAHIVAQDSRFAVWARGNFRNAQEEHERMAPIWKKEREEREAKELAQRQAEYKRLMAAK